MSPRPRCALVTLLLLLLTPLAHSATVLWTADPATPSSWFTPANWSTNSLPTSSDTAQVNNAGQLLFPSGSASLSSLQLAATPRSTASLTLTGGQLTTSSTAYVGYSGSASVTQSDGSFTANTLYLAASSNSTATYQLTGGKLSANTEYIGSSGPAHFTHSGGTNSASLVITNGSAYHLLGDAYLSSSSQSIGNGTFIHDAGINSVNSLYVGINGGNASYTMADAAQLEVGQLSIGSEGSSGTFKQVGGSISEYSSFTLGAGPHSTATYDLSGNGQLSVNSTTAYIAYGSNSSASFTQSGGSVSFTGSNSLYFGYNSSTTASYKLSDNGQLTAGSIYLAHASESSSSFIQSSGNVNTGSFSLYLAESTNSLATYTLSAGSLSTGSQYIGYSGTGVFQQSGGVNRSSSQLYLACNANSAASYTLSAGSLSTASLTVGVSGAATFDQTGGTNRTTGELNIGAAPSSTGSYSLSNDAELYSANQRHAAAPSTRSTFTQSGGTNNLGTNTLYLAFGSNSTASYTLSDGLLSSGPQHIGYLGNATFTQTGGTNFLPSSTLTLGSNSPSSRGLYLLTGPSATLLANAEDIGPQGPSLFRQSAGLNSTGTLTIRAGSRYQLEGGDLFVNSSLSTSGALSISSTGNLATPKLTITSTGSLTLSSGALSTPAITNDGALTLSAGLLRSSTASPALSSLTGQGATSVAVNFSLSASYLRQSSLTSAGSIQLTSPTSYSLVSALSLSPTANLDLTTNTFLINLPTTPLVISTLPTIRQYLHDNLITSSSSDPAHRLAYTDLSLLPTTDPRYTTALATGGDPTTLLITLSLTGDANLDNQLTPDDYALLDRGAARHLSTWHDGDFNYDGMINDEDYLLLDHAFALAHPQSLSPTLLAQRQSQFGPDYVSRLLTSIPEPSVTTCLLAAFVLPGPRRPKH